MFGWNAHIHNNVDTLRASHNPEKGPKSSLVRGISAVVFRVSE
jgi:hypothetical protein